MKTHYHQVIAKQQAYLREGVHSDFGLAVPAGNAPREQTTELKRKGGNFFHLYSEFKICICKRKKVTRPVWLHKCCKKIEFGDGSVTLIPG